MYLLAFAYMFFFPFMFYCTQPSSDHCFLCYIHVWMYTETKVKLSTSLHCGLPHSFRVVVLVPNKANSPCKGSLCLHQSQQWTLSISHKFFTSKCLVEMLKIHWTFPGKIIRHKSRETVMAQTVSSGAGKIWSIFGESVLRVPIGECWQG